MSYARDTVLLDVKNVTKRYGAKEVLTDVSVKVRDLHCSDAGRCVGQVTAFLGPSGCGKTTLLNILAGLEPPTSGQILLNGSKTPVQRGMVGMVFQDYPLWNHRKVLRNLTLAGELSGMLPAEAISRSLKYLSLFGLRDDVNKFPAELSGGMRQRVSIARQLMSIDGPDAHPTRLLLLDEPFSALDLIKTQMVCKMIRNVADMHDQNTILLVTHDLRAALAVADLVWIMGRQRDASGAPVGGGRIVQEIDTAEMGLAWHDDICQTPEFQKLECEIVGMYRSL